MTEIETDYLVVGAGASGMAFVDALLDASDADVVIVDRRHRPAGHWLDAYPFVRLHQPSACYGVDSHVLGDDRIDESGPNAGFYERATATEICEYYDRVLEERMVPSGRVRFFGMSDYLGNASDGHRFASILSGRTTTVKVRRKLVDAAYGGSSVPSRHSPKFEIDPGVTVVPPNDLVRMSEPASGYTVIGAGKTSMDTCNWLLDQGVAPDRIRWIRPRDGWAMNRALTQPLALVASTLEFFSRMIEAAAAAESAADLAHRLEAHGAFLRIDPDTAPEVFRGATLSVTELEALRTIEDVVRLGRVRRIGTSSISFGDGTLQTQPGRIYVDCTATGLNPAPPKPIFEPDRITMQLVTFGIVPWSATLLGFVEASARGDAEKNRLCQPFGVLSELSDLVRALHVIAPTQNARLAQPDIAAWNDSSRLNPLRGFGDHMDDPAAQAAFARLLEHMGPATANLARLVALQPVA